MLCLCQSDCYHLPMKLPSDVPPQLTDRAALARNRARATTFFLHDAIRDEAQHRLMVVNRSFTEPAIITPFPQVWDRFLPGQRDIAEGPVLDLERAGYDLLIHGLDLHWADDPVGQLIQCNRALRPDGFFLGFTLGGRTLHELRASLGQAEAEITGGLSPRVAPMGEIRDLGALLQRAGFALPVADSIPMTASYETPLHLMRDLRAMGEGNALAARRRGITRRDVLMRAVEIYASQFPGEDGRILATFDIIVLTGWAPSPDQPKPLRPGSAQASLAEALGGREGKLPG